MADAAFSMLNKRQEWMVRREAHTGTVRAESGRAEEQQQFEPRCRHACKPHNAASSTARMRVSSNTTVPLCTASAPLCKLALLCCEFEREPESRSLLCSPLLLLFLLLR